MKRHKILKHIYLAIMFSLSIFFLSNENTYAYICSSDCPCGTAGNTDNGHGDTLVRKGCGMDMTCVPSCGGHKIVSYWISLSGRKYSSNSTILVQPTCTSSGKWCSSECIMTNLPSYHCKEYFSVETLPAFGHEYGSWHCDNEYTHTRQCNYCSNTQTENHNYNVTWLNSVDHGDTHTSTYRFTCKDCGYSYQKSFVERHDTTNAVVDNNGTTVTTMPVGFQSWQKDETLENAETRTCKYCSHTESAWIGINATKLDEWTTESVTITGSSKFWSECDDTNHTTHLAVASESITSINLDTGEEEVVSKTNTYTETREGRYKYIYKFTDTSIPEHSMSVSIETVKIDHSSPQIDVSINTGGKDNNRTKYDTNINYIACATVQNSNILYAETKWTNQIPTITVSSKDYFKDSEIEAVGSHSLVIYNDKGEVVSDGIDFATYTLNLDDEGTHTFTIVATDKLVRKGFDYTDNLDDYYLNAYTSIYNLTKENACDNYDLYENYNYDINHVTITYLTVHLDITAPIIAGTEDVTEINIDGSTYYADKNTVFVENNKIEEFISDIYTNSVDENDIILANDSSDISKIYFSGFKDKVETCLAQATRIDKNDVIIDEWSVINDDESYRTSTEFTYKGVGLKFVSVDDLYTKTELIPIIETDEYLTPTHNTSSVANISVNLDLRYEKDGSLRESISKETIAEMQNLYDYYVIKVVDIAGNITKKKIVPRYAITRTYVTTIDPSSYK